MNEETVRLDISIHIKQHDSDCDTGYTVAEWNALTDAERRAVARDFREAMCSFDDGDISVVTPGATEV